VLLKQKITASKLHNAPPVDQLNQWSVTDRSSKVGGAKQLAKQTSEAQ